MWPLRTTRANQFGFGFNIVGHLDARGFIEWTNDTKEGYDMIKVYVSDPESDSGLSTLKVPYYLLMPCEKILMVLRLERYQLLNREDSPCRVDYPLHVASVFMKNFTPSQLYNPVHAPKLPYDQATCIFCRNSKIRIGSINS